METCLQSVFNQNLTEDELEILIIDDGSSDNSVVVATELTKGKNNVVIISQENKGLGGARNTGIVHATGIYVLFLDADDWLVPNVLKELLDYAINYNLDVFEFAAQGVDINGKIIYHISNKSALIYSGYTYYNSVRYMNSACNKLYKRDFLLASKLFFIEKIYIEDFEFNTRVLIAVTRIKATNKLVAQFLQTPNSITRNTSDEKRQKMIADVVSVIKKIDNIYKSQLNSQKAEVFFLERLNFLVATLFFQLIKNKASYQEMYNLKIELLKHDLFYVNHIIFDFKKNIMRIVLLKNLWIYKWCRFLL